MCAPPRGRFRGPGGRTLTWRRPIGPQQGMSMNGRRATYLRTYLISYVPPYPPDCLLRTYLIGLWIGCWQTYHPFPALTQLVPRPTWMDEIMA